MKEGDFNKAKEISYYALHVHGANIDEEYHSKLEQKQDPRDPFGLGKMPKNKRIKYG